MSEIWKNFSKAELQNFIGESTLSRLEKVIPVMDKGVDSSDRIYTKESLSTIFNSFSGPDLIKNKRFRSQLLNHIDEKILNKFLSKKEQETLVFEEKVKKIVSKGWEDQNFCKQFIEILNLPKEFLPAEEKHIETELLIPPSTLPLKVLKDYQSNIYFSAVEKLKTNFSRFVIQMPTGSGKTRTAMEIISHELNNLEEGKCIIWLAHSEELCEQAHECFLQVWPHVGQHKIKLIKCWGTGGKLAYDFSERTVIIAGFQKLHSLLLKNNIPFNELSKKTYLLVIDEAHKVLAATYTQVTKALLGEGTRVIGLTATPGRSVSDPEENKALAEFFFNEILRINAGDISDIKFLRDRKVLAKVKYDPLITQFNYKLTEAQKKHIEQFFDISPDLLKKIGSDDIRNIEILKKLESEANSGGKILFFACNLKHSKFICAMLIYMGFKAAHIDGSTSTKRRQTIIDNFKRGELQLICNYGVLSTGFDAPKTDVVFIARPTSSIVLYSQMIGRGLRGPAIGGTANCKVIDVKDNIEGFSDQDKVYEYFDDYFE